MVIGRVIGMMDGAGREAKMACVEPMDPIRPDLTRSVKA